MRSKKTKVIVLYGGKSAEHEVSCRSADFVLRNLDKNKYDVQAIAIDKAGQWLPQPMQSLQSTPEAGVPILRERRSLMASESPGTNPAALMALSEADTREEDGVANVVVFPVIHGTNGEDGTLQGMLELTDVAYVGPDVLGSAVGMDKVVAKKLVQLAGVPIVPYVELRQYQWEKDKKSLLLKIERELGFPVFVKPARQGSSVGVSKVKEASSLENAVAEALSFDDKVLVEKGLNVREIECAVLGDYDPEVSIPGEVIPHAEFYSYEAKYQDPNGASLAIPAKLSATQTKEARDLAKQAFVAMDLYGMARVDLFLDKDSGMFYFNEVNTIPGFTVISQYPMLWKESGMAPGQLVDRLIELALKRQKTKSRLSRDFKR